MVRPLQGMKPTIEEIAAEYAGRLTVVTLDIDQNNHTPYRLGIRGVPTLMVFKGGEVVGQKVGLTRKSDLTTLIDARLI
jgi:thioredoxin 1